MQTLPSRNLSLGDIHRLLNFRREYNNSFNNLLSLDPLTEFEAQELTQIRNDFDNYLTEGGVSEGQVKLLVIAPLLRLAGYYQLPIKLVLEEDIAEIVVEDEGIKITGRLDILVVNKIRKVAEEAPLWILIVESKNSEIEAAAGLPQLLSYSCNCLKHQEFVWGLTTNGMRYQFVHILAGNPPTYQLMPFLNLMDLEPAIEILQVLKAIRSTTL